MAVSAIFVQVNCHLHDHVLLLRHINPNLGEGGKCSLDNSETVQTVTLASCSIQLHFNRDIRAKFGIPNQPQSPDIELNADGGILDFRISGQFIIKENYHKSRTSGDIDMKLGPETKLVKGNKTTSKKIHNDVMSANCDVIVIFPIYDQFGAIQKPDSARSL